MHMLHKGQCERLAKGDILAPESGHQSAVWTSSPKTSCRGGSQILVVFVTVLWSWPTPPGHADDDSVRFPLAGSPRAWPREPVGKAGSERLRVGTSPHVRSARPFDRSRGRPWNIDNWGGQTCGCQKLAMAVGPLVA